MPLFDHRHVSRHITAGHPLAGKTVYIPTMAEGSSEAFAATFRWLGIDAQPTPPSNERTRELGGNYTTGASLSRPASGRRARPSLCLPPTAPAGSASTPPS